MNLDSMIQGTDREVDRWWRADLGVRFELPMPPPKMAVYDVASLEVYFAGTLLKSSVLIPDHDCHDLVRAELNSCRTTPAAASAPTAEPDMCCGGVAIRALCPFHGPESKK